MAGDAREEAAITAYNEVWATWPGAIDAHNVEAVRKTAMQAALKAGDAALAHAGFAVVPAEPSEATLTAMVKKGLSVSLGGGYRWPDYMADLYRIALAASTGGSDAAP